MIIFIYYNHSMFSPFKIKNLYMNFIEIEKTSNLDKIKIKYFNFKDLPFDKNFVFIDK